MTGYLHPDYAQSLSEFGQPRLLPRSGAWILERPIPGTGYRDATGCYPLFVCPRWSELSADLEELAPDLVSLAVVTDPFGDYDADQLRRCFKDLVIPYKQHFVADLSQPIESIVSVHHLRNARKAHKQVSIVKRQTSAELVEEWACLYDSLIERHRIQGIAKFSREAFEKQLEIPGMNVFAAFRDQRTVGMTLWCVHGDIGYYHLGAYNDAGYRLRASFGLFWRAFEYFAADGVRWINLGATAGVRSHSGDGLTRFKHGWSTATRTAYFCGRIFNRERYLDLVTTRSRTATEYFPSYRCGEFSYSSISDYSASVHPSLTK